MVTAIFQNRIKILLIAFCKKKTRARSTRVIQYRQFANSVLFTDPKLDGEFVSPYPHKNIFASKYILANTQSVSGRHRQQNKEYFDKAFNLKKLSAFVFVKKFCSHPLFMPLSVSIYVRTFFQPA